MNKINKPITKSNNKTTTNTKSTKKNKNDKIKIDNNQNQMISGVLNITETETYFQAYGIKGNANRTCINASNQSSWIKDTIQNFEKWASSSNSPPPKIMEELMKASMCEQVKYLAPNGEELTFNKEEGESNHEFFKRLMYHLDTK